MSECQCQGDEEPGPHGTFWCERHQCRKSPHHHDLCQHDARYRSLWESGRGPGQAIPTDERRTAPISRGAGTEVKKIFRSWGISACRGCLATAEKMDRMGVPWCLEHIDELSAEIHVNAEQRGWTALLSRAATMIGVEGPVVRWAIREACRRADKVAIVGNDYTSESLWRWVTTAELVAATIKMLDKVPSHITAIIGIPRSGMIPAATLATMLHLPLYELTTKGPRSLDSGWRGHHIAHVRHNNYLVVDDTVYGLHSITRARKILTGENAQYTAVYVRPVHAMDVDFYSELLPSPHLLEWNFFNSGMLTGQVNNPNLKGGFALDMDGVICENNHVNDGRSGYEEWLPNAKPRNLPRFFSAPLIITYRCERHRAVTEDWLRRWGCKWDRLVMAPFDGWRERNRSLSSAEFKARHLSESACVGMVESHSSVAKQIAELSGKRVIALETGIVYSRRAVVDLGCLPNLAATASAG